MRSRVKADDYEDFLLATGLSDDDVMYCGDDVPDYEIMQRVGLPVAPADAASEIRILAKYVSPVKGGEGVARDVIEQVMKVQGLWMTDEAFGW
jgi:3-deoxy-D-manno-octulosonate 8-phosphate phosphatase (KDO 8-P phosphatase)